MSQAHFPFKVNIASLQLNGALESHPELSADTCASECRAFRARRGELAAESSPRRLRYQKLPLKDVFLSLIGGLGGTIVYLAFYLAFFYSLFKGKCV